MNGDVEMYEQKLKELEAKCQLYQRTEDNLMIEIDELAKAYGQLEEQTSRKVFNLTKKEDQVVQLVSEKSKLEQKNALLLKQNTTQSNVNLALKKTADKQEEYIKNLEAHQTLLTDQVVSICFLFIVSKSRNYRLLFNVSFLPLYNNWMH